MDLLTIGSLNMPSLPTILIVGIIIVAAGVAIASTRVLVSAWRFRMLRESVVREYAMCTYEHWCECLGANSIESINVSAIQNGWSVRVYIERLAEIGFPIRLTIVFVNDHSTSRRIRSFVAEHYVSPTC
jgi:hypothetical protein